MDQRQIDRIMEVRKLMKRRDDARNEGDFAVCDEIRDKLQRKGVKVIDQKGGPSGWKFEDGSSNKIPPNESKKIKRNEEGEILNSKKTIENSNTKDSTSTTPSKLASTTSTTVEQETGKRKRGSKSNENKEEEVAEKEDEIEEEIEQPVKSSKKEKKSKPSSSSEETSTPNSDKKKKKEIVKEEKSKPVSAEVDRNLKALKSSTSSASLRTTEGVLIEELQGGGSGSAAVAGKRLTVHYAGRLANGKEFDRSVRPFKFRLGRGEVIRGWDVGMVGMKKGERRRLTVPPEKGYGRRGAPPTIPGNATLIFDVTLLDVD